MAQHFCCLFLIHTKLTTVLDNFRTAVLTWHLSDSGGFRLLGQLSIVCHLHNYHRGRRAWKIFHELFTASAKKWQTPDLYSCHTTELVIKLCLSEGLRSAVFSVHESVGEPNIGEPSKWLSHHSCIFKNVRPCFVK